MIRNRRDLIKASDEEIRTFFKTAIFRGTFISFTKIESEKIGWACGKVENITINGETNDLCPPSLWIPNKYEPFVKDGSCEFKTTVDLKALRNDTRSYKLIVCNIKNIEVTIPSHDLKKEQIFRRNLKLKDNRFVGQFTINSDGSFTIRDIRRSDFSKLILQNGKEQNPIVFHPRVFKPVDGVYYEFTWLLNAVRDDYVYLFRVDESQPFKAITPYDLIRRLHDDIMNYPAGAGQKIVKMLDTLKNQLTASGKEIFIYELLQNANDYPNIINGTKQKVDVEFHLTSTSLIFMHTGAVFNERNIAAICSINDKEKDTNKDAIGYKGIGFKTVFLDNENVYLQTGGYSFRFDRQETKDVVDTPWQILPIWTKFSELTPSEKAIFSHADSEYRVKFALKPIKIDTLRSTPHNYEELFKSLFVNERVILFIPNLGNVKIYLHNTQEPDIICNRCNDKWRIDDFEDAIKEDITQAINADINEQEDKGTLKIPTKYYDFKRTKVSFACEVEGTNLRPVKDTCLYCYLPAKEAKWGFKFLMNTDMIPNGARDDIEIEFDNSINVNEVLAQIAGSKFFDWIHKLCLTKEYNYESIFSLIPNFTTIKREHGKFKKLIELFKGGFDSRIKTDEFIPTENGYVLITDTLLDETGLSASGIISDNNFINFIHQSGKSLPESTLRKSQNFLCFLATYLEFLNAEDNIFDVESLHTMVNDENFKEWLKVQENNDKFLSFLLEQNYLEEFLEEDLFIEEECGELYSAGRLYYDIDEDLEDLSAFSNHLCYLSLKTRELFKKNKKWQEIVDGHFAEFDCCSFIKNILLEENYDETVVALGDWITSYHFYAYIAKNGIVPDNLHELPFFNDEENPAVVDNFKDKFVFISSSEGKKSVNESWLSTINFAFISQLYDAKTIEYLKKNVGIRDFSYDIIVNEIILCNDYKDIVNESQQEDLLTSIAFVRFCFDHKNLFSNGSLCNYALNAFNCEGSTTFVLPEANLYFPSLCFDSYSEKNWIESDWMYCLNGSYLVIDGIEDFIKNAFCISDLDDQLFYKDIVRLHIPAILNNTSGSNDADGALNIDFVSYLDTNYQFIFEEEKDADKFSDFVLIGEGDYDISPDETYVYAYDTELEEILGSEWFPSETVHMCTKRYSKSKAIVAIKAKRYDFGEFFNDVIAEELPNINKIIKTKEGSIAFHNFVINRLKKLTDDQKEVMRGAKVYLYGKDEPVENAGGHKILSSKAKELFEIGLVEFEDLDLIDPDYKTEQNTEYWETRLENTKFTITHFYNWLKGNADTFKVTLQDEKLNIKFWRWLKSNADAKQLGALPKLPVLLKSGAIDDHSTTIYFSDEYMDGSGIEQSVLKFDENAMFISPEYIEQQDDIKDWKEFWLKLGIKCEIVDILIETIIPNLEEIDDESLPKLIADNRTALEKNYGEDKLISHLTSIRLKAKDGKFYSIDKTIYIDCEKEEPFPYIELPTQISFKTPEERALIKDIIREVESDFVETLSEWQQHKIDCYLEMQDNEIESIREIHYRFINDLSVIRNSSKDRLKDIDGIEKIYLLNKDNKFCNPSTLTMGTVYRPFFDFEKCGVDSLEYVNDSYIYMSPDNPGKLFRALKVHCDIQKDDLKLLEARNCAIYFWSKYLIKKEANISRIKEFLEDSLFDDVACIPTKDQMKTPRELYFGTEVLRYVKAVEDWENKTPLKDLPEIKFSDGSAIFEKLPFKDSLDFLDALYALINITGQERRAQLIQWMIEDYDPSYDEKINEYREDDLATWYNNKNEPVQIKRLYALDYWEKTLEQYFGNNPRIINKAYLPSGDSFRRACDIFQIETITSDDLEMEPVDNQIYSARDINHHLFALIFAAMIDCDNWPELYDSYKEKLEEVVFFKCKSILIRYKEDTDISQPLKKFYHKPNSTDFYFVKDLDDKLVYESYVKEFTQYLGIDEDDIPFDLAKIIMDSRESALEYISEQNSLMLDEGFKEAIDELIPGIKQELLGKEAEEDNEDVVGTHRPSFTTTDNGYNEDDDDDTEETTSSQNDNSKETDDSIDDSGKEYEVLSEEDYEIDENEKLEALQEEDAPDANDFIKATYECIIIHGEEDRVVCEHYRNGTWVRGHYRNGYWVNGYWRNGSNVSTHTREGHPSEYRVSGSNKGTTNLENRPTNNSGPLTPSSHQPVGSKTQSDPIHSNDYAEPSDKTNASQAGATPTNAPRTSSGTTPKSRNPHEHQAHSGSYNINYEPREWTTDDIERIKAKGVSRCLSEGDAETIEIEQLNNLLGVNMSAEEIADTNYLAQMRLYQNLVDSGYNPEEGLEEFVKSDKPEHTLASGKYIHKCSAKYGIVYISPSIWNKVANGNCIICVYLGKRAKDFMYLRSTEDILKWVHEDDILIKLTGEEKVNVVNALYNGVLEGVTGTAYTMIRVASNAIYNPVFAQLIDNPDQIDSVDDF